MPRSRRSAWARSSRSCPFHGCRRPTRPTTGTPGGSGSDTGAEPGSGMRVPGATTNVARAGESWRCPRAEGLLERHPQVAGRAGSHQPREPEHPGEQAMNLSHATRGYDLDPNPAILQLGRPGTRLEEHQLELMPAFTRPVEHRLKHRLGAAEALTPRNGYEYAHALQSLFALARTPSFTG